MKQSTSDEINHIMAQAKMMSESEKNCVINDLDVEQPLLYQTIFGQMNTSVAETNMGMSKLFEELCFYIIFFYYTTFGDSPIIENEEKWLGDNLSLLDSELKALSEENTMELVFREKLLERLVKRSKDSETQLELHKYINNKIQKHVYKNEVCIESVQLSTNLIFVIIRLMDELYKVK